MDSNKIKEEIKKSYGRIADSDKNETCCVENSCCSPNDSSNTMSQDYSNVSGYKNEADLGLGCGMPTAHANINQGDVVIDLGSGAGNDVFIARSEVGVDGKVIGVDFTPEMITKARMLSDKMGYTNVKFVQNEIENMKDVPSNIADMVISNCVMNLVPNKQKAFSEINRVLSEGGKFCISDIVYSGTMPEALLKATELHVGCIAGASEKSSYLGHIKSAGFKNIKIIEKKPINLSEDLLSKYLSESELKAFHESNSGIQSVTISAEKLEDGNCCESSENSCCNTDEQSNESCCESTLEGSCC